MGSRTCINARQNEGFSALGEKKVDITTLGGVSTE